MYDRPVTDDIDLEAEGPHLSPDPEWGKRPPDKEEQRLLLGPDRRDFELARVWRIARELLRGFRALHFVGPCVTVFGSARFPPEHRYYKLGCKLGAELARAGFTVMTGGGPGIMEAANRGAKLAGGVSIGCNIELPHEQHENPYLDRFVTFRYFFVRKVMLVKYSYAFVALPGGFGTLDEIFETATLVQTGKINQFPIVLMGTEYWGPLIDFLRDRMVAEGTIARADLDRLILTDSAAEAVDRIRTTGLESFGLTYGPGSKPRRWMGEPVAPERKKPVGAG